MSVLRSHLSPRMRLWLVAAFVLLFAAVVAAPEVSSARAAVKQFTATMSPTTAVGQVSGSWTETVKNCGTPVEAPCTAASTIGIGQVRISVPSEFRPVTITTVTATSPRNWTASYDSSTGVITARALTGSDKLASGESVAITFSSTPSTCATGSKQFTTTVLGSLPGSPDSQLFTIVGPQPTITITGCQLGPGDSITDPTTGQTETVDGDFSGHVIVTFGGNLDCSEEPLGSQWSSYHLPTQVTITPADDFVAGEGPKFSTSTFTAPAGNDSSWYLICYATNPSATTGTILQPCYPGGGATLVDPPCVDKQYRDFTTQKIVITIMVPPGDPLKH